MTRCKLLVKNKQPRNTSKIRVNQTHQKQDRGWICQQGMFLSKCADVWQRHCWCDRGAGCTPMLSKLMSIDQVVKLGHWPLDFSSSLMSCDWSQVLLPIAHWPLSSQPPTPRLYPVLGGHRYKQIRGLQFHPITHIKLKKSSLLKQQHLPESTFSWWRSGHTDRNVELYGINLQFLSFQN